MFVVSLHQALKELRDQHAAREQAAAAEKNALDMQIAALDDQEVGLVSIHQTPIGASAGAMQEAQEDVGGARVFSGRTHKFTSTFLSCGDKTVFRISPHKL